MEHGQTLTTTDVVTTTSTQEKTDVATVTEFATSFATETTTAAGCHDDCDRSGFATTQGEVKLELPGGTDDALCFHLADVLCFRFAVLLFVYQYRISHFFGLCVVYFGLANLSVYTVHDARLSRSPNRRAHHRHDRCDQYRTSRDSHRRPEGGRRLRGWPVSAAPAKRCQLHYLYVRSGGRELFLLTSSGSLASVAYADKVALYSKDVGSSSYVIFGSNDFSNRNGGAPMSSQYFGPTNIGSAGSFTCPNGGSALSNFAALNNLMNVQRSSGHGSVFTLQYTVLS
ncbi:hypothetical protein PG985_015068 [Apiospora marii]|uniref:uncharacterized protein n=1 Tax=Apiospora marii TaxID=335849 RepID=UPI00312D9F05